MKLLIIAIFGCLHLAHYGNATKEKNQYNPEELFESIRTEAAERSLQCGDELSHCEQRSDKTTVSISLCEGLLKGYLCDKVDTSEGIKEIVEKITSEDEEDDEKS